MPKQVLQITNFSGGLNAYSDARDIEDNQFVQNWNAAVDTKGVIRVAGMAKDSSINTDFDNTYFQEGYGLFQFSTDYSFSIISGDFSQGIKSGTLSAGASTTATLESTYAGTSNEFMHMQIFIYSGTGVGQSRQISSSSAATPAVLTLVSGDNWDTTPDNTSKYIIYPWKLDGTKWFGKSVVNENIITNGFNDNGSMITGISKSNNDYYIASRKTASDNSSTNLGYIEYPANTVTSSTLGSSKALTIKPGINYTLSFDCAAKSKWYNAVSDGDEDGSDITTIGDKVPWVQLYSDSVADTKGSIKTHSATATLSAEWSANGTYRNIAAKSTTGNGIGAIFDIVISTGSAPSDTATFYVKNRGEGYVANEVLTFADPSEEDGETGTITVTGVNVTGLTLGRNNWIGKNDQLYNTGIKSNESEVSVTSGSVTLTVDTTSATDALVKNRNIYKSDGTFIGICTTVNSTTEIVLDQAAVAIPNDTDLYTSNYLDEVDINYIDNGDFADGTSDSWTESDSSSTLTLSELASNGYDGDDGTCRMVSSGMNISAGIPASFIYQDLTLDDLTSYDLNFLYDSKDGIRYAVYNNDTSSYIIDWTTLGSTKTSNNAAANYSYPVENIASINPDVKNKSMNYITFSLNKSATGTTSSIRILFSPVYENSTVDLHGVTLYKAHHDLVSMAYNKDAACPFYDNIQFFNRYSFSFKLPSNYTTVTDWKLRFHAGQFGYRASNGLGAEPIQKVFFDNITLTAEESDTITVLTDNKANSSNPLFYSESSNSWINNIVNWNYQNSKANYNYINGMLKICDANFDSNNPQALVYYDKVLGWKTNYEILPNPPEVFSRTYDDSELADERFDGIEYLNKKYEGLFYDFQSFDYGQTDRANWKLDQFGPGVHQGILLAHVHGGHIENNVAHQVPQAGEFATSKGNEPIALYDMDSEYYRANYENEEGLTPQDGNIQDYAGVAGWTFNSNNDFTNMDRGNRVTGDGWTQKTFQLSANHPIEGENIGFAVNASSNAGEIHSIDLDFEWELFGRFGREGGGATDNSDDGPQAPIFNIYYGPTDNFIPTSLQNRLAGKEHIDIDKGGFISLGEQQIPLSMHQLFAQNKDIYQYYGEPSDILTKYEYTCSDESDKGEIKAKLRFKLSLPFTEKIDVKSMANESPGSKNIAVCIEVKEFPGTENETNGYRGLLERQGQGNGQWRRSIKVSDNATDWSLDGGVYDTIGRYDGYRIGERTSMWERFFVNQLDIRYTSKSFIEDAVSNLGPNQYSLSSKKGAQVNFAFGDLDDAFGWGNRMFNLAATNINRFGEESAFHPGVETIGLDSAGNPNIQLGECPSVTVGMTASQLNDSYIKQTKFYMKDTESDIWYLQFYVDHSNKRLYSSTSTISASGRLLPNSNIFEWTLAKDNFKNFNEVNSYEAETMVSQEDGQLNSTLTAEYKTSVIANNRLYVGNVKQNNVVYADRMIKSPIGKYNVLPASNFIDVAINDGDEITGLAYYKDKILQFKKRKVFVINVSGDFEFLEDTFDNIGVEHQAAITKTPYGIVWANKEGCYLYDGNQIINLIEGIIATSDDYSFVDNNFWVCALPTSLGVFKPVVGYMKERDTLLVATSSLNISDGATPDAASYHFATKSWMFNHKSIAGNTVSGNTGNISNMITNIDGSILYYRTYNDIYSGIKEFEHKPLQTGDFKYIYFTTKDFTFGNIANRKKIYKIYITYRVKTDGTDSGVSVYAQKNNLKFERGTFSNNIRFSQSSNFAGTSTACYSSETLNETDGEWKTAELKFDNPSEVNNIYSFQMLLYGSNVAVDFEVNDISIVFKTKRVK